MHSDSDDTYNQQQYIDIRKQKKQQKYAKSKKFQNGIDKYEPQHNEPAQAGSSSNTLEKERPKCMINNVPMEVLIHIFARLDPSSMIFAAQVCKFWRHIIKDDTCWRQGFIAYFGAPPFKRLASDSWKSEYVLRTHLHRKWEKGRGTVVVFDPKIGPLANIYVNFQHSWMLSGTLDRAMATKSDPSTGKTERTAMFGHEDAEPSPVSSMKMDGHQIIWGHFDGYVTITTRTISTSGRQLKRFSDFHEGPVTAVTTSSTLHNVVLSGGQDGIVKIWDIASGRCVGNLLGARSAVTKVRVDSRKRIIAGCIDGSTLVWNVDVVSVLTAARNANGHRHVYEGGQDAAPVYSKLPDFGITPPGEDMPVMEILYDDEHEFFIVQYSNCSRVYKYSALDGQRQAMFENPNSTAKITCIQWDKEATSTNEEEPTPPKVNVKQSRHQQDIIAASNFPVITSNELFPSVTIRILASGDENGNVCLFDMDSVSTSNKATMPLTTIHGHHTAISAIYLDACKVVTGSTDGWIKIWDPISGVNIKILHNKIPRNAPVDRTDMDLFSVRKIVCTDYVGVAIIGNQIKSWDFSPDKQLLSRRKLRPKKANNAGNLYTSRGQLQAEIHEAMTESKTRIADERKALEEETRTIQKLTLGLSDTEALEYAIMLSEEASVQATPAAPIKDEHDQGTEEDEELMQAVIASLESAKHDSDRISNDEEGDATPSNDSLSLFSESTSVTDDRELYQALDDPTEWPSIGSAKNSIPGSWSDSNPGRVLEPRPAASRYIEDEDDEELQYVLKLSMGEV
ncbi:hypothetical protein INT44_006541 [Umbelopsis vinacea]|uniref:F-box domain-containing protein n=1 Tax=Umbelopsis vinacea TaxID=44442 RepID=A0A8H7UH56_9FUNG|nr:hypothetical protein INT44_006541 [Umbelopsis vinacea]